VARRLWGEGRDVESPAFAEADRAAACTGAQAAASRGYQARQQQFIPFALAASDPQRLAIMRSLSGQLQADPYDAEMACEWSWLARLSGDGHVREGFLRAVWSDPEYACGWYGLSVLATDPGTAYGLLRAANELRQPWDDVAARERLVAAAFANDAEGLLRWRILEARARVRTAQSRGQPAPAELVQLAQQALPGLR
jgi:hypothetical protein